MYIPQLYLTQIYKPRLHLKQILPLIFTTAARWTAVVIESKSCLIDLPTFSYSPTRANRDIVVEGNELEELEEVKTLWKAILELG